MWLFHDSPLEDLWLACCMAMEDWVTGALGQCWELWDYIGSATFELHDPGQIISFIYFSQAVGTESAWLSKNPHQIWKSLFVSKHMMHMQTSEQVSISDVY